MPSTLTADLSHHASARPIINASATDYADFAPPPDASSLGGDRNRSDEILIRLIVHRHPEALNSLYARYEAFVITIARRILVDPDDAEETRQDVFLLIWNHAERFNAQRGTVKGWIGGLTHFRAIDRSRKRQRLAIAREKIREEFTWNATEHFRRTNGVACSPQVGDDGRAVLREAVKRLPPEQRQVLLLTYMAGMSQREITRHLGVTLGVVKHRLSKAMRAMTRMSDGLRGSLAL